MIQDIGKRLALQAIDTTRLDLSQSFSKTGLSFAQIMGAQAVSLEGSVVSSEEIEATEEKDSIVKNSFTGFFQELQEKRMEELRKEILEAMGLTEEMLAQMDPEARGRIEGMIAKEIQKRMTAQSAMDGEDENQSVKNRMMMADIDLLSL